MMGTANPKVSGYVPQELKDALTAFSKERGLTESQCVQMILAEYFDIPVKLNVKESVQMGGSLIQRVSSLEKVFEAELSRLEFKIEILANSPLNSVQLTERLGLGSRGTVNTKKANCYPSNPAEFRRWSREKDPDGVAWDYWESDKKFHPVFD